MRKAPVWRLFAVAVSFSLAVSRPGAAQEGGKEAPKDAAPKDAARKDAVYFVRDVMPALSKAGCNQIQCHGGSGGKGGLKLSLFGAEPQADYEALTRAAEGRRIDRGQPARSLMLLKATAAIPHEGGPRLKPDSPEYAAIAAWIAQDAPCTADGEPKLVSVKVAPGQQVLKPGQSQKLSAAAAFSDGTGKDVTALVVFKSSDPKVATVDPAGTVKAESPGEALVTATYVRQSDVARVIVPQALWAPFPKVEPNNKIDERVLAKLQKLGIPPSGLCTDEVFLRRVYLDVLGTLPTAEEVRAFLGDKDPKKRSKLIDALLERDEFADYWALKWGDLLRIKSEFPVRVWPKGAQTYYRWVRQCIAENKPYDQFARELLTASGSNFRCGAANFFRAVPTKDPQTIAESAALVFMGARIGCARCHGHPTENWGLDDNLGMAAVFAKVAFKATQEWKEEVVYVNRKAALRDPRTKDLVKPKVLGGQELELGRDEDPRRKFADWLISPENPWFARNIVNRVWSWLLGRGIVHEPDDLRPTNPPENPELLEFLEKDFIAHKYDLKHLYRQILNSKTYQLSSKANDGNKGDLRHFSRYWLKRLGAEELLDAIGQVTETSEAFASGIPEPYTRLPMGYRATQLYDGDIGVPFLELFGRPPRDTPYECERDLGTSMRQALHLINSDHLQNKVSASPRIRRWIDERKTDAEIVEELYLIALSRLPKAEEKQKAMDYLALDKKQRTQAIQDLVWAVLNTKEFVFNH